MLPTSRRMRATLLAAASATLVAAVLPEPAPLGIGDRLFPTLGNPGYNVTAYDIGLTYSGDHTRPLDAVTTLDARATEHLDRVNLDFTHGTVRSVRVNGSPAAFTTVDEDLVITPRAPLEAGDPLRVTVRHTSDPTGEDGAGGWVRTTDGLVTAGQANAAHRVFPGDDHPADKAYFTFHVTAPHKVTVVANGERIGRVTSGPDTTWTYRTAHPMATELVQISLGDSAVITGSGPHGLPVRDVVPAADRAALKRWTDRTPAQLRWMEQRVGPYPFENYGVLIAGADTGFELETQTLSLFERSLFTSGDYPAWYVDSVMVHELTHQWFGDSVSPRRWSDVWLNEAHATWYEALYAQEHGGPRLADRMRDAYTDSDTWRAAGGPPAAPKAPVPGEPISIFRPVVYDGSALALYALRQEIGADAFARVERDWVREHRDSTADTADFVRLASRDAGRDLRGFLDAWLYGTTTPPMPGHPDWRSASLPRGATPAAPGGSTAQNRPVPGPGDAASTKDGMGHLALGRMVEGAARAALGDGATPAGDAG